MWKLASALLAVGLVAYGCGSSDEHQAPRGAGGAAGEGGAPSSGGKGNGGTAGKGNVGNAGNVPTGDAGNSTGVAGNMNESGAGNTAGAPDAKGGASVGGAEIGGAATGGAELGGAGGADGAAPIVLPDALIVNVPYTCDSPFDGVDFPLYHYLENFEDHTLNTPGVTASSTTTSFNAGYVTLVDSVDCDDGKIDGTCASCDALFSGTGAIDVTFDAHVLGALPTHVGLVWTDGGYSCDVTVTGYDAADTLIYTQTVSGIGDNSNYGETAEDRFFGIVHYAGVKRIHLANTGGGIEIDHLQYGR